jgi:hypothetical protein
LIHGDQHGYHSDTPACEDATDNEERKSGSSGLHADTDGKDEDSKDDGPSSTEEICSGGREQSPEESSDGQYGDDEGLLRRGDRTLSG